MRRSAVVVAEQEGESGGVLAQFGKFVAVGADEPSEGGGEQRVVGAAEPVAGKSSISPSLMTSTGSSRGSSSEHAWVCGWSGCGALGAGVG